MKWSDEAENGLKKVPFFIRKKVRKQVEAHAFQKGKNQVDPVDLVELKEKFLKKGGMEKEIKGFEVTSCFGAGACQKSAISSAGLASDIEQVMERADILSFLKANVTGDLKFHHEFRVVISDCPNACSRPQIADVGIIGAVVPGTGEEACSQCEACVDTCRENAIQLDAKGVVIDHGACVSCGQCVLVCPTGALFEAKKGYRVLLGGRLGRHPRLGMEIPEIFTQSQVLEILKQCIVFYKKHSVNGQRFSHLISSIDQIMTQR